MGIKGGNMEEDSNKDSRPSEEVELRLNNSKLDKEATNMADPQKDDKMELDQTESEEKQEKDKKDRETVKESHHVKEHHNPPNGDIETKFVLDNKHLHAALSIPGSRSATPNTARKRRNRHLEEMNMAEMISLSGMESLCTISNYDAMSTRDLDDEEGGEQEEEEEEVEEGIGVHHVLSVLLAMMSVAIVLLLYFLVPCPIEPANWSVEMEGIVSSSPVRLLDVNRDGMDDVIFGFSVGKSTDPPEVVEQLCENLNLSLSCGGGVMAMSGWRGETLWRLDINHTNIKGLVCNQLDVNKDGQSDCLATGSDGLLMAINTKTGDILWEADSSVTVPTWTYSQPQTLPRDLDDDGVMDLVVSHGVNSEDASEGIQDGDEVGRLLLLSGKTGQSLGAYLEMPDGQASVSPPIIFQASDDEDETPYIVFGSRVVSGPETNNPGSMWVVSLERLYCHVTGSDCIANTQSGEPGKRDASSTDDHIVELVRGTGDGFVLPAIVADLTMDEVNDLIVVSHDAIVTVINGSSFKTLWSRQLNVDSQYRPYSVAAPGHFNHDEVPDLMIQLGLHEPSSNTSSINKMVIIDGLTGEELWHTVTDSSFENQPTASIPSPLSLRAEKERDAFLFWLEHFPVTEDGTTTQSNVERCSDLISTYPTLSLVMMDRDMAMDPPSLVSFRPYKPITTTPSSLPSDDMTTRQPMDTSATSHMTSAASEPSSTVVVDITPVLGGSPTTGSLQLNASSLPVTASPSSSTSSPGRVRRSSSEDCYMMEPVLISTGIIDDFDDDGSLELIVAVNMMPTYLGSSASPPPSSEPQSRLTIRRVSLERALDQNNRIELVQADSFLSPSVENSTVSGNIFDHFDLLETKSQTWLGFMGTKADGRYT